MATNLRKVRSFAHLVRYLEDELGWPLAGYEMSEITFEYDPEELGLKKSEAAKIRVPIRQLRPLTSSQPWGIFFIEFDCTRLPIAVLRRILSHLVIKKRASANKADAAAWAAEDLLFISAFGADEDASREINFAHFHKEKGDLPTLRVLGWDGNDTNLKVEYVDNALRQKLRWPEKEEDIKAWRTRWSGAFKHRVGHVINTADLLAEELAALARRIRDAASELIGRESENGRLKKLHAAFKTHLIHDLTEEGFADTYAQTIAYGLLTAAISQESRRADGAKAGLIAENLTDMVPVTNPFLKEMLETFLHVGGRQGSIDFDELGVQDVVELLRSKETDLPAVLRDFGNRTRGEDPVIHFYEHFLAAYNKQLKIQRGVFYTPQPVVSYIVRSVHELLQSEFGLIDGLADTTTWGEMLKKNPSLKLPPLTDESGETRTVAPDEPFVQILDPATGTATFLVEVIDVIARTLHERWTHHRLTTDQKLTAWNEYVPKHLLPRLHAFELMMAPYAIAHMKIGLKLAETGYRFGTEERARIYLTNALDPWVRQLPLIGFGALAHEASEVNEIKKNKRFTVILGNPPYSGISSNMTEDAQRIVDAYKVVDGAALNERKLWLQDDYVKFIRTAQSHVEITGTGVLGFITNHGYFDNPTFRGMRQSLLKTFPRFRILDLHGNTNKKERAPDGGEDKNVFDIRQGVGICLAVRQNGSALVQHAELWGSREIKYRWLATRRFSESDFQTVIPDSPYYFFKPHHVACRQEYDSGWRIPDIFPLSTVGFVTARDALTIQHSRAEMWDVVQRFASISEARAREEFELGKDARDWKVSTAQQDVRRFGPTKSLIAPVLYRPFDIRYTYYTGNSRGFYASPCSNVMKHMQSGKNLSLCFNRREELVVKYSHFLASRHMTEHGLLSSKTTDSQAPLYLLVSDDEGLFRDPVVRPNLGAGFLRALAESLGLEQSGEHSLPNAITPEDIFFYAYAVFYSPTYRSRYSEYLKIDFPRLPLTGRIDLFRNLALFGSKLTELHVLESTELELGAVQFIGVRAPIVEKVEWASGTVWLDKAKTQGFSGISEEVWNFNIGGYQVCGKWLKDRKGRSLSADDRRHYQKIIAALSETIRLMKKIDEVIEIHGGWPNAFVTTGVAGYAATASKLESSDRGPLDVEGELPLG